MSEYPKRAAFPDSDEGPEDFEPDDLRRPIAAATDRLTKETEILQSAIERLIDHLRPVLGPSRPEMDSGGEKKAEDDSSDLAKVLNRHAATMRNYSDLINRTNERVEL